MRWHYIANNTEFDDDWYLVAIEYQNGSTAVKLARANNGKFTIVKTDNDYCEVYAWAELPEAPMRK